VLERHSAVPVSAAEDAQGSSRLRVSSISG
jgi:hypothetical protein